MSLLPALCRGLSAWSYSLELKFTLLYNHLSHFNSLPWTSAKVQCRSQA